MERLEILLFLGFHRHRAHAGARGGFRDSFGIRGIVLVSFDIGLTY
jgi:hypothetical protein